jgi:hypothetical protein
VTRIYLAWSPAGHETLASHADVPVDLLVPFPGLKQYYKRRAAYNVRSWFLDSGAFTAKSTGFRIDLADYTAACRDADADEVAGLDVIGDPAATRRNLEAMWASGVPAIPTFHFGSPWAELAWCAAGAPKIALGGVARAGKKRVPWILQCFARVWPKPVHGFGVASVDALRAVPFHSVDASSWLYAPQAMGHYAGYTGRQMPLRSRGVKDFWVEAVEHHKSARWAAARWRRELASLEAVRA